MKKKRVFFGIAVVIWFLSVCSVFNIINEKNKLRKELAEAQRVKSQKLAVIEEPLIETVKWMMEQPKCKGPKSTALSEAGKAFLSKQIERIFTDLGGKRFEQDTMIGLICRESQFRANARSSAGAIGLTQMLLSTAQMEADRLGMGKVTSEDLTDPEISLTLGYSHFLYLSKLFNGNLAKIAASYNGGPGGATMKSLKTGGMGAHETDAYVTFLFNTMEELRIHREKKRKSSLFAKHEVLILDHQCKLGS